MSCLTLRTSSIVRLSTSKCIFLMDEEGVEFVPYLCLSMCFLVISSFKLIAQIEAVVSMQLIDAL